MSDQVNELAVLFPKEYEIKIPEKNETLVIKPFKFKQIFKVIGIIAKIAEELAPNENNKGKESEVLFKFLEESEDKVMSVITLATDKPKEWFDDLEGDSGLDIITAVWRANKSFFDSKVSPLIEEMGFSNQKAKLSNSQEEEKPILTDEEVERILNQSLDTDGWTP